MNNLKTIFPSIRERAEVMNDITVNKELKKQFDSWNREQQESFLDCCTGVRGVKVLTDSFFKEVMNPELAPDRINDFLSVVLRQKVKVLQVLPNDSIRIAAEGTLLITDLVVELENGGIVNVEVQRIGYMFPGERAACYSADLLLRQYKRIRDRKKKKFTYKDIKPVYTIVLFEGSPKEFKQFPDKYIHYMEAKADTGVEINLLQKYVFISLDIFQERSHNKIIRDKLEAWLSFFSMDKPEEIERLIREYPQFKPMYETIYDICLNTERVMGMFSKELQILDENTVQYMIDEMQNTIDGMQDKLIEKDAVITEQEAELTEKEAVITKKEAELTEKEAMITEKDEVIIKKDMELTEKDNQIRELLEKVRSLEEKR